jgi:hypothetical protein
MVVVKVVWSELRSTTKYKNQVELFCRQSVRQKPAMLI